MYYVKIDAGLSDFTGVADMVQEFEYFDFIPRREFKEGANSLLTEICKEIPLNFSCEARCTFFANKFFFQILFRSDDFTISSQTILDPKREQTENRDWQIKAIEHMSQHIRKQLEHIKSQGELMLTSSTSQAS